VRDAHAPTGRGLVVRDGRHHQIGFEAIEIHRFVGARRGERKQAKQKCDPPAHGKLSEH
jgi:hypothetical protein